MVIETYLETLMPMVMNDREIRASLIRQLGAMAKSPNAILEELRVHNGNAIADVVAIHSYAHCYEIKGDNDNIYRAVKQSEFYDFSFKKNTLVTTDKFIDQAKRIMPLHWGLMTARIHQQDVKLSYVRSAGLNPNFNKKLALLTLWKSELLDAELLKNCRNSKKFNRHQLAAMIAADSTEKELLEFIGRKLVSRAASLEMM